MRNGRTLTSDDNTSVELYSKNTIYTERNTVMSIPKADRARDTGRYTIKLVCEAGTFEASANVNVLDVPSKCRCMHVDEVRAEHVKLSWAVPEDDGGTPITSYLVRYMDIDSGEWVTACSTSTPSATAQGLKPGHLYMFEISAINKEGQSEPLFTGDAILANLRLLTSTTNLSHCDGTNPRMTEAAPSPTTSSRRKTSLAAGLTR